MRRSSRAFRSIITLSLSLGALALMAAGASAKPKARKAAASAAPGLSLPYVVGPELYQIYTNARFYDTVVTVNGHAIEYTNSGGDGSYVHSKFGISIDGALGYPNEASINGLLTPGANVITVEFVPNPEIAKYVGSPEQIAAIIPEMFTRVMFVRGELTDFRHTEERDLEALLAGNARTKRAEVLKNEKTKVKQAKDALRPVRHEFTLQTRKADKFEQVKIEECELEVDREPETLTASTYLDGRLLAKMDGDSLSDWEEIVQNAKPGTHPLSLEVESLAGPSVVSYELSCDLDKAKQRAGLTSRGDIIGKFGNYVLPVAKIEVNGPGSYGASFELAK